MLNLENADNAVHDITRHLACECYRKGIEHPEKFIRYVLFSVLLNPDHNFTIHRHREGEEFQILADESSKLLLKKNSPSLATLKIQSFVAHDFESRETVLNNHHDSIFRHSADFIRTIIEAHAKTKNEFNNLQRKLVLAVVLLSGLGDPSLPDVFKEASVALKSVFNENDLQRFLTLTPEAKMVQLKDLTKLVAGIRLFNKSRGKGGKGIVDLPPILEQACDILQTKLETILNSYCNERMKLLRLIEECCLWDDEIEDLLNVECPGGLSKSEFKIAKEFLCLKQQLCSFVRKWINNIKAYRKELYAVRCNIEARIFILNQDVKFRVVLPTRQVYPQFVDLSDCWSALQDLTVLLSIHNSLFITLTEFQKEYDMVPEFLSSLLDTMEEVIEEEPAVELQCTKVVIKIDPSKVNCKVIYKQDFPDKLELQYCGFCPVHILEGDGVVLEADKSIGLLVYENKYYGFYNIRAAHNFGKNPDYYIKAILDFARRFPEYLDLLDLRPEAVDVRYLGSLVPRIHKKISERTKEVQCEDHPYFYNIDVKYKWNIWDLKKDAVQLANILRYRTHSTQTNRSHFKEGVGTQTQIKKEVGCQTMKDGYSNVPKPSTFIFGLRGRREEDQHKIILTRPVYEGPCKIIKCKPNSRVVPETE